MAEVTIRHVHPMSGIDASGSCYTKETYSKIFDWIRLNFLVKIAGNFVPCELYTTEDNFG